jgi:plastocyanin
VKPFDLRLPKPGRRLTLALATALALAGSATAVAVLSVPAAAQTAGPTVRIANFTFGPQALTVAAGSTVTWINADDTAHTVVAVGGAFRSKALDTDDRFSFTFAKPGEYAYFCSLHPHMTGKVVVTPG